VRRLAIITGTTHGLGRLTSRELARAGYTVLMLCRNLKLARQVRDEITLAVPGASVEIARCDLASFASIRDCVARLRRDFGTIDLLINNAGMVSMRRRMSSDGLELCFATNHLGPFLLTRLLLDRMASAARIINLSSCVHFRAQLDLRWIEARQAPYRAAAAYAQSKLANTMFSFALARRLSTTGITVNCLHPGVVATNLLPAWLRLIKPLISRTIFDPERGARTTLHLALAPELAGHSGRYFDEYQREQPASALASNVEQQELLWSASERWTGLAGTDAAAPSL
jgi:NAD(P)-dependent dehydrogenase (short-subunit alcohol dehydrogenase family)